MKISKELFEAVMGYDIGSEKELFMHIGYNGFNSYNDFFFECIDFISTKGYVFVQDTAGFSMITHLATSNRKIWEDEEYNKQRVFDACQWILENK